RSHGVLLLGQLDVSAADSTARAETFSRSTASRYASNAWSTSLSMLRRRASYVSCDRTWRARAEAIRDSVCKPVKRSMLRLSVARYSRSLSARPDWTNGRGNGTPLVSKVVILKEDFGWKVMLPVAARYGSLAKLAARRAAFAEARSALLDCRSG